jgi:DNA-binding MurR/RpiR family transcriptional regulator
VEIMARSREQTLGQKLRQVAAALTKAERRVARVLLSSNLKAGLQTVAGLATQAQVSGPTVLRFVTSLGFESFPAFQQAVRIEVPQRVKSPAAQFHQRLKGQSKDAFMAAVREAMTLSINSTLDALLTNDFDKVIKLLSDKRRQVFVLGGRFTQLFANYLAGRLYQLRPGVRTLGSSSTVISNNEELLSLRRTSVLFVFDLRRYQLETIELAREAEKRGAAVILVTDTWLSPIADFATVVLTVPVDTPWGYDSFANCAVLIEVLFGRILSESNVSTLERIKDLEGHQPGVMD